MARSSPAAALLKALVLLYRWFLSPWLGGHCRFQPTCSEYALEALTTHGARRGGWLTLRRLARCHPLGGQGFDPVPLASDAPWGQTGGRRGQPPTTGIAPTASVAPAVTAERQAADRSGNRLRQDLPTDAPRPDASGAARRQAGGSGMHPSPGR